MRYRPTNQQTDQPTDTAYYRDARTYLKRKPDTRQPRELGAKGSRQKKKRPLIQKKVNAWRLYRRTDDITGYTFLAINVRTTLKCHNSLNFNRREMIFFFKICIFEISIKWDQAGPCIFIRLEMRAKWIKHLPFASVVGQILWRMVQWHTAPNIL